MSVCQSTTLIQSEMFQQQLEWIAMKFCTNIHGPQRIYSNDFGNPLTFHLVPPAGQSFHLSREMPLSVHDGLAQNYVSK